MFEMGKHATGLINYYIKKGMLTLIMSTENMHVFATQVTF